LTLSAPVPLAAHHAVVDFDCGAASLNDWLKKRALRNQVSGASRTFVTDVTSAQARERQGQLLKSFVLRWHDAA